MGGLHFQALMGEIESLLGKAFLIKRVQLYEQKYPIHTALKVTSSSHIKRSIYGKRKCKDFCASRSLFAKITSSRSPLQVLPYFFQLSVIPDLHEKRAFGV